VEQEIVTQTKTGKRRAKLPDSYFELVKRHPLRSIRTEADLDAAQAVIDDLLRRELDAGELAYLDALSDLVLLYERDHHPIPPLPPHDLLAQVLADRAMSQADLARATGLAKATVSDLVSGKRAFTVDQMHRVAGVFGLPARVFLPRADVAVE
jgi:HTH-type transcriptional regulator / antitoxin HigA